MCEYVRADGRSDKQCTKVYIRQYLPKAIAEPKKKPHCDQVRSVHRFFLGYLFFSFWLTTSVCPRCLLCQVMFLKDPWILTWIEAHRLISFKSLPSEQGNMGMKHLLQILHRLETI